MDTQLARKNEPAGLPPILAGNATSAIRQRVGQFFYSLTSLFESWVTRRKSPHTQRAYREDIMTFVKFMGWEWPGQADELLRVSMRRAGLPRRLAEPKCRAEDFKPAHQFAVFVL